MQLRFSTRGGRPDAVVHLTVVEDQHSLTLLRRRGEALCRPATSLPNLELLLRQVIDGHHYCPACVDALARLRLTRHVELPISSGLVAADLIRQLARDRESLRRRLPKRVVTKFMQRPAAVNSNKSSQKIRRHRTQSETPTSSS